jgi:hypothetical protein
LKEAHYSLILSCSEALVRFAKLLQEREHNGRRSVFELLWNGKHPIKSSKEVPQRILRSGNITEMKLVFMTKMKREIFSRDAACLFPKLFSGESIVAL